MDQWAYRIGIDKDSRLYRDKETKEESRKSGFIWAVYETYHNKSLVVSPGVFDSKAEAKQNALETLTLLAVGSGNPLHTAIQSILEDE